LKLAAHNAYVDMVRDDGAAFTDDEDVASFSPFTLFVLAAPSGTLPLDGAFVICFSFKRA
jgi:hypothetical protein